MRRHRGLARPAPIRLCMCACDAATCIDQAKRAFRRMLVAVPARIATAVKAEWRDAVDEATKLEAIETVERLGGVARRLWPQIRRSGVRPYAHPTAYPPRYWAERAVEAAIYMDGDEGVRQLIRDMEVSVAELQGSMARRTGDERRQNYAEWEQWSANDPLPHSAGPARRQARSLLRSGLPYPYVLWLVTTSCVAGHPPFHGRSRRPEEKLSRPEAHNLKRGVDAA